ncbi:DUF6152 family protein [Rhodoplanes roseus]|uniref:Uncharacterized protein n=1 Tax=Rhodoplanes roseus TaxID=29409 RepID=A0A327LE19_9BRAD|nr:DUF6152 family protein [Rhodoplanes roseus]RAI46048.1 hypothetical protein CH341_01035 [Rhodoplanes roseus]
MPPIVRSRLLAVLLLLAGLALFPPIATAHHGWGSYDADKPMTVQTTIDEVTIGNPHGSMVVTHGGKRWDVILAPPSRMNARGATAAVVAKGRPVTVYGYPRRDGAAELRAEWIEIDGKRFELR